MTGLSELDTIPLVIIGASTHSNCVLLLGPRDGTDMDRICEIHFEPVIPDGFLVDYMIAYRA